MKKRENNHLDFDKFLLELSSEKPTPGGGSIAALAGSVGAALIEMSSRITLKQKDLDQTIVSKMELVIKTAGEGKTSLRKLIELDAEAYDKVLESFRLPKNSDAEKEARTESIQNSFKQAAEVPLNVMEETHRVLESAYIAAESGSRNCISDIAVGILMLHSAILGAKMNVEINLKYIKDDEYKIAVKEKITKLHNDAVELVQKANMQIAEE